MIMKSNYDIVSIVYRDYKIGQLIRKLINDCAKNNTCGDLEQFIYMKLMTIDNFKLNELYYKKDLRRFISQIIKNQRNYYGSEYNKMVKVIFQGTTIELDGFELEDKIEHNFKLDITWKILEDGASIFGLTGLTQFEMRKALSYHILKYYVKNNVSMIKLAKQFGCCRSTINTLIKFAKQEIKKEYDIKYSDYDINSFIELTLGDLNS